MRTLHIANGHQLTSLIEQTAIGGETSVWADPLHDGPVPAGLSDAALRAVRAAYLAGEYAVEPVLAGVDGLERRARPQVGLRRTGAVVRARSVRPAEPAPGARPHRGLAACPIAPRLDSRAAPAVRPSRGWASSRRRTSRRSTTLASRCLRAHSWRLPRRGGHSAALILETSRSSWPATHRRCRFWPTRCEGICRSFRRPTAGCPARSAASWSGWITVHRRSACCGRECGKAKRRTTSPTAASGSSFNDWLRLRRLS